MVIQKIRRAFGNRGIRPQNAKLGIQQRHRHVLQIFQNGALDPLLLAQL